MTSEDAQMLDDYFNGRELDSAHLETALLQSRELRDEFRKLSCVDTVLHLHHAHDVLAVPGFSSGASQVSVVNQGRHHRRRVRSSVLLGMSCLVLLAAGVLFSMTAIPGAKTTVMATDNKPTVATVLFARDTKLQNSERALVEDSRLMAGPFSLASGSVTLIFDGGCEITINSPAELTLLSSNAAMIHRGELLFENSPMCDAFELTTPHSKLLDIGTMYSLEVDEQAERLSVHEGEVWRSGLTSSQEACLVVAGKGYQTGLGVVSLEKVQSPETMFVKPEMRKTSRTHPPFVVYDSFDYPAGQYETRIPHEHGAGWRGGWAWFSRDLEENPLENSLVDFHESRMTSSDNTVVQRHMAVPIDTRVDGTTYFVFDFEFNDLKEPDILFYRLFSTLDTEENSGEVYELLLLGHQNRIVSRFGGTQAQEAFEFQPQTPYRLIGKILSREDGPDQIYVTVMAAKEAIPATPPAIWTTATRPAEIQSRFDFLAFHTYSQGTQSVGSVVISDDWSTLLEHYRALQESNKI